MSENLETSAMLTIKTGLQNRSTGLQNRFRSPQGVTPLHEAQKPFSGKKWASYDFPEIRDALSRIHGRKMGKREKDILFVAGASDMENLQMEGCPQRVARKMCLEALLNCEAAPTFEAARKKLARTIEGRCCGTVSRPYWKLPEADRLCLLGLITEAGGRMAQGWRHALENRMLSEETLARFKARPARKSWVPKSIRNQLRHEVRELQKLHRGKKNYESKGAYISRDWQSIYSGDWFSGDDATLNHYYYIKKSDGSYDVLRGQTLIFCDLRSRRILHYTHLPERNYTARAIRESVREIHNSIGFPRRGFYFEQGMWKTARLLTGAATGERSLDETEEGLREFVQFKHALSPQAKGVIERIIGLVQNLMEPLPGYVGRDEKRDRYEEIQKKLLRAKSGKIPYESFLLSFAQYQEELEAIMERYNAEPQEGALDGLCPDEAWIQFQNRTQPLLQLPEKARHLLSHHRKLVKIGRNGVRLTFKGASHYYRNEETGRNKGREVLAWFNTEEEIPSSITLTDSGMNYIGEVPREVKPAAMGATPEDIREASRQVKAHNKHTRETYRAIRSRFLGSGMIQKIPADKKTEELGRLIKEGRGRVADGLQQEEKMEAEARNICRLLGRAYDRPQRVSIAQYLDGVRWELELKKEEENAYSKSFRF